MSTHLVIPDSHVMPGDDLKRFEWLSKLIMDVRPEVIINLGDMADMKSLCSYDKGTRGFEGRRYRADIECVRKANDTLFEEINKFNKRQRKNKKSQYHPHTIFLIGNHEHRIQRAIDCQPVLDGTIGISDLHYHKYYKTIVPYLDTINIDNILYAHCIQHDLSPAMIGGEHHANSLLLKKHCSVTVGHSHKLDYKIHTKGDGQKIMALVAGCCFDFDMEYAPMGSKAYWRGVCLCKNVRNGEYDLETINLDSLRSYYGRS